VYDRLALILDSDDRPLAQASTSLIVLGHAPLYADDLDDLLQLAVERKAQVGALLLPAEHAFEWWPVVRKRIVEPLFLVPRSVLPVGPRLAATDSEALHCDGLRWALAEPFTAWDLRFAVSLVLAENDLFEFRLDTRVPCSIPVELDSQGRTITAEATDLSPGGVFVQLAHPNPEGTPVVLRAELGGRAVSLRGRVAWRTGPGSPPWRDRGMGIAFEAPDAETIALLRKQLDCALDRFRLGPREVAAGTRV
jgi:uncharacterized protein (TIGR02266 family)